MSDDEDSMKAGIDRLFKTLHQDGIVASSVSDGTVFGFTREKLQWLLDSMPPGKNELIVFVKSPEPEVSRGRVH